ncbi:hypothetical protein [Streptomyces sp. 1222.5]|uniref:hypothetical protein n=1 Tax=Streptomyces sp. 1222.5 TaxID=1881026 RepID=UPI003D737869
MRPTPRAEAAEAYRQRLLQLDKLPHLAALYLAGDAYAGCNIYVLAAAGQFWISTNSNCPDVELEIISVQCDNQLGHYAVVRSGVDHRDKTIPLDVLFTDFKLKSWPDAN